MKKTLTVLLVEDDVDFAKLVEHWLLLGPERDFVVHRCDSLYNAVNHLKTNVMDVILLDLGLPDSGGLKAFTNIKREAAGAPLILLSGDSTEQLTLDLIRRGAERCVVYKSSANAESLVRAIQYAVEDKLVKHP